MFKRVVHPGGILEDELKSIGITPTKFSKQVGVSLDLVSQLIHGNHRITADMALRFGHWFSTGAGFWMNLQNQFDLAIAVKEIEEEIKLLPTLWHYEDGKRQSLKEFSNA